MVSQSEACTKSVYLSMEAMGASPRLVVDGQGRKILQNQRMNELWKIPPHIAADKDDSVQVEFVTKRTKNNLRIMLPFPGLNHVLRGNGEAALDSSVNRLQGEGRFAAKEPEIQNRANAKDGDSRPLSPRPNPQQTAPPIVGGGRGDGGEGRNGEARGIAPIGSGHPVRPF